MKFQLQHDLTGQKFGKYIVIKRAYTWKIGVHWEVQCTCGKINIIHSNDLRKGKAKQCRSCNNRTRIINIKNRDCVSKKPEFFIWNAMKHRCSNKKCKSYKNYGGRGIKVCDEWIKSFKSFLDHIGPRTDPKLTLDRINNNGNYEPGNVRWATRKQQGQNKRNNKKNKELKND